MVVCVVDRIVQRGKNSQGPYGFAGWVTSSTPRRLMDGLFGNHKVPYWGLKESVRIDKHQRSGAMKAA